MKTPTLSRRHFSIALGALALPAVGAAQAQGWPNRPLRLIAPAPPGGSNDRMARMIAAELSKELGQSVIVENRPGAGSTIGTAAVASAPADGYTLLMSGVFNAIGPALYPRLPYNYQKDFVHLAPVLTGSNVLVTRPEFPHSNLKDFIAAAKAQPGRFDFASAGSGTSGHLTMEILQRAAGIQITHVPYKGSAPAIQDVMGGQVGMIATNQDAVLPLVKSGRLKALAITTAQRVPAFPDTPTFVESGFPDMVVTSWTVLDVAAGTPPAVVERLRTAANKVVKQAEFLRPFEAEGNQPFDLPVQELDAFVRRETERWAKVISTAGIKLE